MIVLLVLLVLLVPLVYQVDLLVAMLRDDHRAKRK
jgi:hypothetical protein